MNCVNGCGVLICLSSGFCSVIILSNKIEVQSGFEICISWYSYEFMFGLMVVINANSVLATR